jgi:hypothetical protein
MDRIGLHNVIDNSRKHVRCLQIRQLVYDSLNYDSLFVGFNVRFCTVMANWTRLPGGHRLRGRRRQTKYNAHTLVTSLPRKVTYITQSYTNNANQKHNSCYQSDTSDSLNLTSAESSTRSSLVPDSWQPVGQFLPHRAPRRRGQLSL